MFYTQGQLYLGDDSIDGEVCLAIEGKKARTTPSSRCGTAWTTRIWPSSGQWAPAPSSRSRLKAPTTASPAPPGRRASRRVPSSTSTNVRPGTTHRSSRA